MDNLQMLYRFHQGTGNFRMVADIESWWRMPVEIKDRLLAKWKAEDKKLADSKK